MKKMFTKAFICSSLITGLQVLFFILFFKHLGNLYYNLTLDKSPALSNLTEEKVQMIAEGVEQDLNQGFISETLIRSFVFFYTENYTKRELFVQSEDGPSIKYSEQDIIDDPFYRSMFNFHLNRLCYVIRTIDIEEESVVKQVYRENGELSPDNYYISCPIFIDDVLVGYIGGLDITKQGVDTSISVETSVVRNSARNIENILKSN